MKWIHRGKGRPSAALGEEKKTKKSKEFLLSTERPGVEDGITRGRRGAYTSTQRGEQQHMWYPVNLLFCKRTWGERCRRKRFQNLFYRAGGLVTTSSSSVDMKLLMISFLLLWGSKKDLKLGGSKMLFVLWWEEQITSNWRATLQWEPWTPFHKEKKQCSIGSAV